MLSSTRTVNRKFPFITFATLTRVVAGPAAAVAVLTSGAAAAWPGSATANPAPAAVVATAQPGGTAALDAFTQPLAAGQASAEAASQVTMSPRQIARAMLRSFGWSWWQFKFLNWLWEAESGWNPRAANPYSGAYGIPQALPGGKMASAGANWRTSATTQIRWGLRYIKRLYGSPYRAWRHEVAYGWY